MLDRRSWFGVTLALAIAACHGSHPTRTASAGAGGGPSTGTAGGSGGAGAGAGPGGSTTGGAGGALTDAGPDTSVTPCVSNGFSPTPGDLPLPAGYAGLAGSVDPVPFGALAEAALCGGGADVPAYSLFDFDGDGRPDLLITRQCNDATVGATKWQMYKNTGAGFAATATDLPLPPGYAGLAGSVDPVPFGALAESALCGGGADVPAYSLFDFDGDGLADLLITRQCNDATVGATKWQMYKNTGAGFAATAADLPLPPGYAGLAGSVDPVPFGALAEAALCGGGADVPAYSLFDFDGDGLADLLITRQCNDATVGATKWQMYKNTGAGFAATATDLPLPSGYAGLAGSVDPVPFGALAEGALCGGGANVPAYSLFDFDGDGRADLVITRQCNDATVGATKWQMYKNTGAGFAATATDLPLPSGYAGLAGSIDPVAFGALAETALCGGGANVPSYSIFDVDGDGLADLVITRQCNDATVGATRWQMYKNTGAGFAATATDLPLPPGYAGLAGSVDPVPFGAFAETALCAGGADVPSYSLVDFDGDKLPDVVMTRQCADPLTGASHWVIYRGVCLPGTG